MQIAQVCHRYYPHIGGVETIVKEISERLVKKGFKVDILTTDPTKKLPKEEVINDVKVQRFRSWAPYEAYYFSMELNDYLAKKSANYDIVHAHGYHAFPAYLAARAKKRNRLIFTSHYHGKGHTFFRNLLFIPYKFIAKEIFKKANLIICVSNYEKGLVMKDFQVKEEKVLVIPNGINLEEFKDLSKTRKDGRVILYVGRLEKYKGVDYMIKAMPMLSDDITLTIIGKGPYKRDLTELAYRLKVMGRVKFYQDLPRKELLLSYIDADLFILLSKLEAFGISVAEALASKTPCIVAKTSALQEWVDNENCFGVKYPINVNELAKLVDEVIGKEVKEVKLLDWDDVVRELIKIYEEC